MPTRKKTIFIAGHKGMVGSAILRQLKKKSFKILVIDKSKLNLLNQKKVFYYLKIKKPDYVIIAAAIVGGIQANNLYKSKFLYENMQIQNNIIHGSYLAGIKNLIFLGSSCIYPKNISGKMKEKDLLNGKLEPTNDAYALAKISGLKMCEYYSNEYNVNYKSLMPTNLYGPGDNYDLNNSHFMPALIKKIYLSKINKKKELKIWGSGKPKREVMHVDDLANACLFFLKKKISEPYINIGTGYEKTIKEYAQIIMKKFKYKMKIVFDKSKPDGNLRKRLDLTIAKKYHWNFKIPFDQGINQTINEFVTNFKNYK
jgi:GDP-L-fucose synthase